MQTATVTTVATTMHLTSYQVMRHQDQWAQSQYRER